MRRHELSQGQMRHEIIFPTQKVSRYQVIIGVILHPKELNMDCCIRHVFAIYAMCFNSSHARRWYSERRPSKYVMS